jgi:hypothetical protein
MESNERVSLVKVRRRVRGDDGLTVVRPDEEEFICLDGKYYPVSRLTSTVNILRGQFLIAGDPDDLAEWRKSNRKHPLDGYEVLRELAYAADLCIDGLESDEEDAPYMGDGTYPPFVVFDIEAQENLPGRYFDPTAVRNALREILRQRKALEQKGSE